MSRKRKNISIDELRCMVNQQLANSNISEEEKMGLCSLLEYFLHETKNYKGYNYLKWVNGGSTSWFELINSGAAREDDYQKKQEFYGPKYSRIYY